MCDGKGLLRNSLLSITAPCSAQINSTPLNYSTCAPHRKSEWERIIRSPALPPPFLSAAWSLTQQLSWKVAGKWQESGRTPSREARRGGPSTPNGSCFQSSSLSAPRSPPWPNHGFLNNSACSSAIIWLFAGYWNMNNEGAERRPFPYFLSSWVCWQERTDGQTDTWTERWENDTDMLLLLFTVWVIFALIIYIVQWLWIKHSLIFYSAWRYQLTLAGLFSNLQTPICWLTDRYHTNILLIKAAAQTSWMTCTSQEAKLSVRVKNA